MDKMNKTYFEEFLNKKLQNLLQDFIFDEIRHKDLLRFRDWYGDTTFLIQITPYLWLIPFLVTVIILVIFKRARLFGYTQRYLFAIMVLDLFYSLLTGIRDLILHLLEMDYGFVEYKMCRTLLLSFYLQNGLHGTSLWIKCSMSLTQCLLVAFPLKFKTWKLKGFVITFATLHFLCLSVFFALPNIMPLTRRTTFKISAKTHKLKVIQACAMDVESGFYDGVFFSIFHQFGTYFFSIYCLAIPTIVDIILIIFLIFLMKKHLKLLSSMTPYTGKRSCIKYFILIKLNIILGLSFILQEVPLLSYITLILTTSDLSSNLTAAGIYNAIMTISFVIGKPFDLIIYACLSDTFRREFSKLFLKQKKGKIFSILRFNTNAVDTQRKQPVTE